MTASPTAQWTEAGQARSAPWRSEASAPAPRRIQLADDTLSADAAYRLACEGTGLLWRGDFQNARQLVQALARRVDRKPRKARATEPVTPADAFNLHRQAQGQRARVLGMVLIEVAPDYGIALRRAPDLRLACTEAWGPDAGACVVSLRELLGLVGAHEWRKKGVEIPALGTGAGGSGGAGGAPGNRIHAHYGVFSPVRGEYLDLIAAAPLPSTELGFDIGTGTGVVAALLARRGVKHIVATDMDARALACARDNIGRLGLADRVEVLEADLFPAGQAPLVVCNPPWLPARPSSRIEHAVYDEGSMMLRGFLAGLKAHLSAGGEGWLVMSDIAEHLGLRTRADLLAMIEAAGLKVLARSDIRPRHPKTADAADALHLARSKEVTSLWRLVAA